MWDVVVGARCAGAAIALRFARAGRSVLLLDKGRVANGTLSTHVLVTSAVAQLHALGLLTEVQATGAPPVHTAAFEWDGGRRVVPIEGVVDYILCVRRGSLAHLGQWSFLFCFLPESDQWVSDPRWRICVGRPLNCGATSHGWIEFMQLNHGNFRDFSAKPRPLWNP